MKKYLVGGFVRDMLLNLPITDRDWVIVGSTPKELLTLGYQQVGNDFPVFLHPITKEEYALARTERKQGRGYTGFICDFDKNITLEQDLIRRDLTINAIAQDESGKLFDPFNGISDINNRILRHISPAFQEDPLRVLRVARFAARFYTLGFHIAPETLTLMQKIADNGELDTLTPERVWKETEKALLTASPQIYFSVLQQCGALKILFPWINSLFSIHEEANQSIKNYGLHMLNVLQAIVPLSDNLATRFASCCLHMNRLVTTNNEHLSPQKRGLPIIDEICEQYHISNDCRKIARLSCQYHEAVHHIQKLSAESILQLLNGIDVWRQPQNLTYLIDCSQADYYAMFPLSKAYLAGEYLQQAYHITKTVPIQPIIERGFKGQAIQQELAKLRIAALHDWQASQ